MASQVIRIDAIDRSGRLRQVDPAWVRTMAERIEAGERLPPIEVVERDGGYRLIAGAHRTEAHAAAGLDEIEAEVRAADAFASEAAIRLREVTENLIRYELTALDRAVHLSAWKECHEALHGASKPGRKSRQNSAAIAGGDDPEGPEAAFAATFSASAAQVLRISERSVRVAVQVATGITPAVREMIALAPIADVMSELIHLSQQEGGRQTRIAKLILDGQAGSVADAIAMLDRIPAPARLKGWEKISEGFSRLPEAQRHAFFEAHADQIDLWRAARMTAKG